MHTEGQVSPLANSILHSQIFNHFLGSQERHIGKDHWCWEGREWHCWLNQGRVESCTLEFHTWKPAKQEGTSTSLAALLLRCRLFAHICQVGATYHFTAVLQAEAYWPVGKLLKGHFVALEASSMPSDGLTALVLKVLPAVIPSWIATSWHSFNF